MPPPALDFRSVNSLWASVLVETLARCGVRTAVISPGSRSTPLAFAFAGHGTIESVPVLDERSAGFFALGLARQQMRPVALLCTSGTAGANYFPAVIEAHESGAPLVVLTADRPPELRDCASGQTIDQQRLFGSYAGFFHELALPEAALALFRYLRQTVAHAVARTSHPAPGPVHLNVPFRDPLHPVDDGTAAKLAEAKEWGSFFDFLAPPAAVEPVGRVPELAPDSHGLIVAGPAQPRNPEAYATAVGAIAGRLGWPVLADALGPARHWSGRIPHLVTAYDAILRDPPTAQSLLPDTVLCLGGWPTSKVLRGWLEESGAKIWLVTGRPDNRDALHGRTRQISLSLRVLAAGLPTAHGTNGFADIWRDYEEQARRTLDERLDAESGLFEPKAAWLLARHLPAETPLFIASSMPVRDAEYVWPWGDLRIRPFFNRGANGIDGTLSTALGVAHGNRPAAALVGDLALLHDSNGFLLRPKFRGSLTVVLINNRGSGIFEHLPVAQFDPPFEEFFATPQSVDFGRLCAAHGVEHVEVSNWEQFVGLITILPASGIRVLEIRTDRKQDAAGRKRLLAGVLRAAP